MVLWGFVGLCALTTLVFPVLFWKYVVAIVYQEPLPPRFLGPTALGMTAIIVRDIFFLGLTAFVAASARAYGGRFLIGESQNGRMEDTQNIAQGQHRQRIAAAFPSLFFSVFLLSVFSVSRWFV